MQLKNVSKQKVLVIVSSTITIFLVILFSCVYILQEKKGKEQLAKKNALSLQQEQLSIATQKDIPIPVLLKIPRIHVSSLIESVGFTPEGEMDIPKDIVNVAWFNLGIRPGEIGSAVIDGHYGWKNFKVAAFDNLGELHKGDTLSVEDSKGGVIFFVVRETKTYDPKSDTRDIFISNDGKSHLNLITCRGIWSKLEKSYSSRLIIFTDKVEATSSPQNK